MRDLDGYTRFGVFAYSLGAHVALVLAAMSLGRVPPAAAHAAPPPSELTFVELAQPPGHASAGGGDAPASGERGARARGHAAAPSPPLPSLPGAPQATPAATSLPGAVAVTSATPASSASELAEAVRRAMLAPAASGAPGAPGGGGDGGAGLGSYKAVLAGWLQARVAGGGGAADEPHPSLRVTARVTLSPARAITGFAILSPSGNAAFDARIEGRLRALSSSGATLPPPPDGVEAPPALTVAFTCKPNERCALPSRCPSRSSARRAPRLRQTT